jgi:hypothetical protein
LSNPGALPRRRGGAKMCCAGAVRVEIDAAWFFKPWLSLVPDRMCRGRDLSL